MRPLPSPLLVVTDRARFSPRSGNRVGIHHEATAIVTRASPEDDAAGCVLDGSCGAGLALVACVDALLAAGARWVWFRERDMTPGPREALARAVLERVREGGGVFTLGGDAALATRLGADGVHLPGGTTPAGIAEARRHLPDGRIGVSAHSIAEVEAAARWGANYATLSPIFPTASKPGYGPALGPAALRAAGGFGLPVVALGGLTMDTVRPCREAGASGIAVMGGLMRQPDPQAAVRVLLDAWET